MPRLAVGLSLLLLSARAFAQNEPHCDATNARFNISEQAKTGYDFVPTTPDETLGFHVVYSAKRNPGGSEIASTACIYVFALDDDEVLIFGSGFGDTSTPEGGAFFDADYDVSNVDAVIRGCLGLDAALVRVRFAAPHGHPDHINVAFIRALERADYVLAEIAYHAGDRGWIEQLPWLARHRPLLRVLTGGVPCTSELASYASPLGRLWLLSRPGHTPGSIDLVLDVGGDPAERVLVRGSTPDGACAGLLDGVGLILDAHGTAIVPGSRRAELEVVAGRGLNPSCFRATTRPRIGTTWLAQVDVSQHPDAALVYVVATSQRLEPGLVVEYGELIVDLSSRILFSCTLPSSGLLDGVPIAIPNETILMGRVATVQATILGGGPELCNALELVIGL